MAIWRRFAIGVAVVALFGIWASAAEASSGQFTRAEAAPDWATGSFAGSITWTDCNAGCQYWFGVAYAEPTIWTCAATDWFHESDPNIERVWFSGSQSVNATVPFDVTDARLIPGVYGQRLCLIVVQSTKIPEVGTATESRLLASTVFTVASPAPPVVPPATKKPANTALPRIKGRAEVGTKLTVSHGSWSSSPTAYKFQWKRCNGKGKNCKAIKGATKSSFTPGKKDIGTRLKVAVTASNSGGKTTTTSKASKVVSA